MPKEATLPVNVESPASDKSREAEKSKGLRPFGIAKGKFTVADDFDDLNEEMAQLFGANA